MSEEKEVAEEAASAGLPETEASQQVDKPAAQLVNEQVDPAGVVGSADNEFGFRRAAEKVRQFPTTPGIYLMKDHAGRVIYVGKAKNLRSRAGSYFLKAAQQEQRTATWVNEICDIDFMECESEVDALLAESRLMKDVQP